MLRTLQVPFTGAHPLAVLPLVAARRRLPVDAACLVIGAMAPDLEYFARGYISGGKLGHEWLGLLLWCLPATLVVAYAWHALLRWPLALAAPRPLAARLATRFAQPWPARGPIALAASAILGAATHLVWDAFTHADGFVVVRVPALAAPIAGVPVHRLLQLGCSVVGVAGLAIAATRSLAHTAPAPIAPPRAARARLLLAVAAPLGAALFTLRLAVIHHTTSGDYMVAPVTGVLAGLVVVALATRADAARMMQSHPA